MRNEAEYCSCIVRSLNNCGLGWKIPDPNSSYACTVKRAFDIMGRIDKDSHSSAVYIEAKYSKDACSFSLKRIEDHQGWYLTQFNKIDNSLCYIAYGCTYKRGDVRSFIFEWKSLKPLFDVGFSIHKKYLDKLPYNKIKEGLFAFENVITSKELCEAYGVTSIQEIINSMKK